MRIDIQRLADEGWGVNIDSESDVIHIYPVHPDSSLFDTMAEAIARTGIDRRKIEPLADEFASRVQTAIIWELIENSQ